MRTEIPGVTETELADGLRLHVATGNVRPKTDTEPGFQRWRLREWKRAASRNTKRRGAAAQVFGHSQSQVSWKCSAVLLWR
ncbi:hypothetical protein AOLI_G00192270 [Acnodon oligacanthus]